MNFGTILAIYFVVWWITLFLVLPFGVKNAHEAGEVVEKGHERGAPVATRLAIKAAINTVLAGIVTAGLVWAAHSNLFGS
ncbi:MAG: DUF1467 family protein [Pseudomonadota bacterium]|nr:DUF1467 family protein [Pseudomonadota bacterium]